MNRRSILFALGITGTLILIGQVQSWTLSLGILNLCLISAIMALGVNLQWGYAGLVNVGTMGFAALGGLAAVLVSAAPVTDAWQSGGWGIVLGFLVAACTVVFAIASNRTLTSPWRVPVLLLIVTAGLLATRSVLSPALAAIEAIDPARAGYLGGLGLPILLSWPIGALFAAGAAWLIGKVALGLKSDYLAIATLGIAEIILAILRNEEWLTRGVKNVTGLPRPLPVEAELQQSPWFIDVSRQLHLDPSSFASISIKLGYAALFAIVLAVLLWLAQTAIRSPWGRMIQAVRDNATAAEAMGKNVTARQLQVFVLGSAIAGIAGAMLVTLEGQFTPGLYSPLRYTFLIWIMVIVGGAGNNWGAVFGGFLIWLVWIEVEPISILLVDLATRDMAQDNPLSIRLHNAAPHFRLLFMGLIMLFVMRFSPAGLLPRTSARPTPVSNRSIITSGGELPLGQQKLNQA